MPTPTYQLNARPRLEWTVPNAAIFHNSASSRLSAPATIRERNKFRVFAAGSEIERFAAWQRLHSDLEDLILEESGTTKSDRGRSASLRRRTAALLPPESLSLL